MRCPKCHHEDVTVINSRAANDSRDIRRRRRCDACFYRWSTLEIRVDRLSPKRPVKPTTHP